MIPDNTPLAIISGKTRGKGTLHFQLVPFRWKCVILISLSLIASLLFVLGPHQPKRDDTSAMHVVRNLILVG